MIERLQKRARKPLVFSQGMNGPPSLAISSPLCEHTAVAPCQLNRVWAFHGKPFPWVKARTYHWTACYTQPRCTTRWGIVPAQTSPHSRRAGPAGHRQGATGVRFGVALLVDGPLETAPNCEALIPKAKATEGERIRISRLQPGESQNGHGDTPFLPTSMPAAPRHREGDKRPWSRCQGVS